MRTNGHGVPVVALDIDGTLADYHGHFLDFASNWVGRPMPDAAELNPGHPLWVHMNVTQETYRACKLAFRQGGLKRWMPAYAGANRLTSDIKSLGAEVWICTTRPYLRLDNIDPDTREWLFRNGIGYDAVIFDRVNEKGSKYEELWRQAGNRVKAVIDDLPEMVASAQHLGFNTMIRDQPYNRHVNGPRRVFSCTQMAYELRVLKQEMGRDWFV